MNSKSTKVKKFIKDVGTTEQLFVFAGSNTTAATSNSTQTAADLWTQSDFSIRVGQNSLIAVVPYVKWTQKRPYKSWSSNFSNIGNFYAYNDQNQYVYLCISDNENNRIDLVGQNISNIRPTHTAGIQKYADGYSWKPLYKVTSEMQRFISSTWLPVISFENFDGDPQFSQLEQTRLFCDSNIGETGNCAIYAKIPLSTDDDNYTVEYEKGDLFTIASTLSCSDCFYLMKDNDKFKSVFYSYGEEIPSTTLILTNYEMVGQMISSGEIGQYSPYYYLYTVNENDDLLEGSIISAFIDLSGYTSKELICTIQNPTLTITSGSGLGGEIYLKTIPFGDSYIVQGIEVSSRGYGYRDISFSLNSSLMPNLDMNIFLSKILVNLDTIDGLGFDPVDVLDSQHVMIDARLEKRILEDAGIILPDQINFFGLVKNPFESATGANIIAGSNQNKKIDVVYRTTIKIETLYEGGIASGEPTIVPEETIPVTDFGENNLSPTIKTGGVKQISDTISNVEIKGILYEDADYLLGLNLDENTVTSILEKPNLIQFTGNILTTNKQPTNLSISDVDSVIIRINMVQGM